MTGRSLLYAFIGFLFAMLGLCVAAIMLAGDDWRGLFIVGTLLAGVVALGQAVRR
jgi:hypothetical protein